MLQFDRIKIVSSSQYFRNVLSNPDFKIVIDRKSENEYRTYSMQTPYFLSIMVNQTTGKASIEFTSKILKDRCVELISANNIKDCLNSIVESGICLIDVDGLIHNSTVHKLDITRDLDLPMTESIKTLMELAVSDCGKWDAKIRKRNGIDIKKNVKSNSRRRERLSFYDKGMEQLLRKNQPFLNSLTDEKKVTEYFNGKTRVEYNLVSGAMIKEVLGIDSLDLMTVLNCGANPLFTICNKIFDRTLLLHHPEGRLNYLRFDGIQDYYRSLLLEKFGNDIETVELVLRHFYSEKTNFRKHRILFKRTKNRMISESSTVENQLKQFDDILLLLNKNA